MITDIPTQKPRTVSCSNLLSIMRSDTVQNSLVPDEIYSASLKNITIAFLIFSLEKLNERAVLYVDDDCKKERETAIYYKDFLNTYFKEQENFFYCLIDLEIKGDFAKINKIQALLKDKTDEELMDFLRNIQSLHAQRKETVSSKLYHLFKEPAQTPQKTFEKITSLAEKFRICYVIRKKIEAKQSAFVFDNSMNEAFISANISIFYDSIIGNFSSQLTKEELKFYKDLDLRMSTAVFLAAVLNALANPNLLASETAISYITLISEHCGTDLRKLSEQDENQCYLSIYEFLLGKSDGNINELLNKIAVLRNAMADERKTSSAKGVAYEFSFDKDHRENYEGLFDTIETHAKHIAMRDYTQSNVAPATEREREREREREHARERRQYKF